MMKLQATWPVLSKEVNFPVTLENCLRLEWPWTSHKINTISYNSRILKSSIFSKPHYGKNIVLACCVYVKVCRRVCLFIQRCEICINQRNKRRRQQAPVWQIHKTRLTMGEGDVELLVTAPLQLGQIHLLFLLLLPISKTKQGNRITLWVSFHASLEKSYSPEISRGKWPMVLGPRPKPVFHPKRVRAWLQILSQRKPQPSQEQVWEGQEQSVTSFVKVVLMVRPGLQEGGPKSNGCSLLEGFLSQECL